MPKLNSPTPNRDPKPEDLRMALDDWIAEVQSLQPDHSLSISTVGTGWDSLCLIYLLTHVAHLYWFTDDIIRKVAQKAYQANYEGEWKTVQFFLEQNPQTPEEFYRIFLQFHSPEEFFGNLKKRAKRIQLLVRTRRRDPHGPVSRGQRVRGYRDKGTLRPIHKYHGDPPVRDPEKEDRRSRVGHPLLKDP